MIFYFVFRWLVVSSFLSRLKVVVLRLGRFGTQLEDAGCGRANQGGRKHQHVTVDARTLHHDTALQPDEQVSTVYKEERVVFPL